jgi:hypothetical protein
MSETEEEWRPGSFTKNFGWGERRAGLRLLHRTIRVGFGPEEGDVPRELFRKRTRAAGLGEYIPVNFFLFNRPIGGVDHIIFDELVFQAMTSAHSPRFDKLALFAFNFSYVGRWARARQHQQRPALWAFDYIRRRVAAELNWDTRNVTADDIERFVTSDPRYRAQTARKLATNLNYLYQIGRLSEFADPRVDRWWVDALFLALDRLIEDRALQKINTGETQYGQILTQSNFQNISGKRSLEKDLAARHLLHLYIECGGRQRFSQEYVRERTAVKLPDLEWYIANDARPQGALHPTNLRILKTIPRACAMLAKYSAGFEVIDADELENFDPQSFIRRQTQSALERLSREHVEPTMSAEELMKLTRDR